MIPIYIPSYNRANTISSTQWLDKDNIPYKVLVHTEKCRDAYVASGRVAASDIIVTNVAPGITNQRNYIVQNLAVRGQWYVSLDDNIKGFKRFNDTYYNTCRQIDVSRADITQKTIYQKFTAKEFMQLLEADIAIAEKIKAEYIGYATVDNYFFNAKKYKTVGYVISKAVAIKYNGLQYDTKLEAMEDFGYCAEQLIKNNCVLINSWIKPIAGHYEPGGIGTYEQRVDRKIVDSAYLMHKYPNFFRYKSKKGCHPKAELQLRFNNPKQIKQWKQLNCNR